jgi:hypothetical protein
MQLGLTINDCRQVFAAAGTDLTLIGGQAVSLWAAEFEVELGLSDAVVSKDIDYWGDRTLLIQLAKKLNTIPIFPDRRAFTILSGIVRIRLHNEPVNIDVLNMVPGVPDADWDRVTVVLRNEIGAIRVLDPVGLIGSKFYNLKHFPQDDRNDLAHLLLCIRMARLFVREALRHEARHGLDYVKRILNIACQKNNQSAIKKFAVPIFESIPIDTIMDIAADTSVDEDSRIRLNNFISIRWAQLKESGFVV